MGVREKKRKRVNNKAQVFGLNKRKTLPSVDIGKAMCGASFSQGGWDVVGL